MKILQIIPSLAGGGAERFVVDLCNCLVKNNEVILVTFFGEKESNLFQEDLNADVENIILGKKSGFDVSLISRLYKTIKSTSPDVIHTHVRGFVYLMPLIPLLGKIPLVHTVHNDAFRECPNKFMRGIRKWIFNRNNVMPVTISKESALSFRKAYQNVHAELIYNGRQESQKSNLYSEVMKEVASYKKNEHTKVFITVGRQVKQKNQLMMVKAFGKLVKKEEANAVLLLIGKKRNTEDSIHINQELIRREKESNTIYMLGERKNAPDYMYASDFFCLSSKYEGMPITLIEAFATGTISICTPVGGVTEMVSFLDPDLLSENLDVEAYYKVLKRAYYLDQNTKRDLEERARKLFKEKFSIERCSDNYQKIYEELV